MNDISLVDLFFIITGAAVVIITIMVGIGLIYVITFIRTIKNVAKTAQRATELVSEDVSELRDNIRERGVNLSALSTFAKNLGKKKFTRKK
jgi:hypothetical protein